MAAPSNTTSPSAVDPLALMQGLSLGNTYGAMLLGTFFGLILYGVLLHQAYYYIRMYAADRPAIKLYVAFVLLLDTLHTAVIMYICYLKLVTNYFNILSLFESVWPMNILTLLTGTSVIVCQSFFAYRVYRVGRKSKILVAFCMLLLLAELGFCIAATVKAFGTEVYQQFEPDAWMLSAGLGIAVFVDTVLAAVLVYVLHTSRTGVKKTNSMLDTLIAYAVCTGLLTDIFNILGFVFVLWSSQDLLYAAFNVEVAKIYTNSVLAALNFRHPREPVTATYEVRDVSDICVAPIELSGMSGFRGPFSTSKGSSDRTVETSFTQSSTGVIAIKVPRDFCSEPGVVPAGGDRV